jgi:hypothetical protein
VGSRPGPSPAPPVHYCLSLGVRSRRSPPRGRPPSRSSRDLQGDPSHLRGDTESIPAAPARVTPDKPPPARCTARNLATRGRTKSSAATGRLLPLSAADPRPHTRPQHFRSPTRLSFKVISVRWASQRPPIPTPLLPLPLGESQTSSKDFGSAFPGVPQASASAPGPSAGSRTAALLPAALPAPSPAHKEWAAPGHRAKGGQGTPGGR